MKSIEWLNNSIRFLDQTKLPLSEVYIETSDISILADAIRTLKVRGAPLLGIASAYGVLLGIQNEIHSPKEKFFSAFEHAVNLISSTRPTAKNLFWALERMRNIFRLNSIDDPRLLFDKLKSEALLIHEEDRIMCEKIGKHGAELIPDGAKILTHCNTGALATGGIGTAFGVILTARNSGKNISVFVDETRPLLQGARLTMWEFQKEGIPATLINDNAAAWTIKTKKIDLIIVGADRIAMNGDSANKIGTYNLAVLAKEHRIPFYIAAPTSTIDRSIQSGEEIQIEERDVQEVTNGFGKQIAPNNICVFNPAFDVTPSHLISAIITEKGVLRTPFSDSIAYTVKQ
ncbi:MAG TPA: S-methyl-5-thioribose-1-phosphate isomerase [Bacteroidetes bacterium]|nr:S-methyl-5-thioribose-1-phosphate isomerase [Bacteroidota bacterium]